MSEFMAKHGVCPTCGYDWGANGGGIPLEELSKYPPGNWADGSSQTTEEQAERNREEDRTIRAHFPPFEDVK